MPAGVVCQLAQLASFGARPAFSTGSRFFFAALTTWVLQEAQAVWRVLDDLTQQHRPGHRASITVVVTALAGWAEPAR